MACILVVDDAAEMRSMLVEILSLAGHQVWTAASGEEALLRVKEGVVDLVLLDISMPEMNGYDVLKALREMADGGAASAKVVMMSALGDAKSIERALELGAQDYFVKGSIEIDYLLSRVAHFVGAEGRGRTAN